MSEAVLAIRHWSTRGVLIVMGRYYTAPTKLELRASDFSKNPIEGWPS